MVAAADIVAKAREWIGTPYQHQGRTRGLAVDCAGVPVGVAVQMGLAIEDFTAYASEPNPQRMQAYLDRNLERIPKALISPADVIWIRFQKLPQHLAIVADYYLGGLSIIHASNTTGSGIVVEHRLDDTWAARIVAAWRYPGVT